VVALRPAPRAADTDIAAELDRLEATAREYDLLFDNVRLALAVARHIVELESHMAPGSVAHAQVLRLMVATTTQVGELVVGYARHAQP
jgi:hypothetical protein